MTRSDRAPVPATLATVLVLTLVTLAPGLAAAQPARSAEMSALPHELTLDAGAVYDGLRLTLGGPDDLRIEQRAEGASAVHVGLTDSAGNALPDGLYAYELRGRVEEGEVLLRSGFFTLRDGAFVSPDAVETPGDGGEARLATKATVLATNDGVIRPSLCVGIDCDNSESFGFTTLKLKENNTQIEFSDTSSIGSFPTTDWVIRANDSANGGASRLAVDDLDSGRTPFSILAGAPESSLFVDAQGDVGFGTSVPVLDLHVVDGNTPGLRLEQDTSASFDAQTWDVAGNELHFFVRDVTNGADLVFRIQPGAPQDSLFIGSTGAVGLGTGAPTARLDVAGDVAVSGLVDGRDVAADGAVLDAHVVDFANPHQVTAAQIGLPATKAGILPAASFAGNPATASVTFTTPYPPGTDYVVELTAFTSDAKSTTTPNLLAKDETGFTVTLGDKVKDLVEVDWFTRPVGE